MVLTLVIVSILLQKTKLKKHQSKPKKDDVPNKKFSNRY